MEDADNDDVQRLDRVHIGDALVQAAHDVHVRLDGRPRRHRPLRHVRPAPAFSHRVRVTIVCGKRLTASVPRLLRVARLRAPGVTNNGFWCALEQQQYKPAYTTKYSRIPPIRTRPAEGIELQVLGG